jgi:hypothetical protein
MFVNILRVHNRQLTAFMDVTEVDSTVTSQGTVMGALMGLGHVKTTPLVGNLSGTLEYQESPTIRYTPLFGQSLVSQLTTPISIGALANLINSGWDVSTVLDFACDRITPNPYRRLDALNLMQILWYPDAIIISAEVTQKPTSGANLNSTSTPSQSIKDAETTQKSASAADQNATPAPTPTPTPAPNVIVQVNQPNNSASNAAGSQPDSLVIYKNPAVLRGEISELDRSWSSLRAIFRTPDNKYEDRIILRTVPMQTPKGSRQSNALMPPVIQTRSAYGVLKTAMFYGLITFVSPEEFANPYDYANKKGSYANRQGNVNYYYYNFYPPNEETYRSRLVVLHSKTPPTIKPYVIHFDGSSGEYFYIAGNDRISQDSFTLLSMLLTMQATAPPPALTPTITVGGKTGS